MRYSIILLILFFSLTSVSSAAFGKTDAVAEKVIFSVFDVTSAGKYSYLRDGVQSMLISRLSATNGIEILDQKLAADELVKIKDNIVAGKDVPVELEADYLVTGALFAVAKGLNVQIVFYPLSPTKKIVRFSVIAENDTMIFSRVDELTEDIAAKVFGYEKYLSGARAEKDSQIGAKGFVTIHPEVAYKKGLYAGSVVDIGDSAIKVSAEGVKRTANLPKNMIAMARGDVDGDGIPELAILFARELRLFHVVGRGVKEIAKTKLEHSVKVHAINMADLDGNGKMEIYLSATKNLYISSLIMEWDKTDGFRTVKQYIPWYIRPINHPVKGMILAGQGRGINRTDLLKEGVFQLALNDKNKFEAAGEIVLPRSVNLFDFIYADIDGDAVFETVTIDQREKLRIYDQENGLIWVSNEKYGGSKTYIGPSQGEAIDRNQDTNLSSNEDSDRDLFFVPGRVIAVDLDSSGKQNIVVVSNVDSSFNFFNKLRMYDGGSVVGLTWNGSALVEIWRTGRHSGYIADFDFFLTRDMTTGVKEKKGLASLYIGQIPNSGTIESLIPGSAHSKLTIYQLGFSLKKPKVE